MNHTTHLLALALLCFSTLRATSMEIDSAITTHTNTYNTANTAASGLAVLFGVDRSTPATTQKNTLTTLLSNIQAVIDNTGGLGVPSGGQLTSLNTLKTNVQTLKNRVTDHETLGLLHTTTSTILSQLAKVDTSKSASANAALLATAVDSNTTHQAAIAVIYAAAVGASGGLKSSASTTEFGSERTIALLVNDAVTLFATLLSKRNDLLAAIAATPSPNDETIPDYDSALNDAQSAIESAGALAVIAANNAKTKTTAIIALDRGSDTVVDYITVSANLAKDKTDQLFKEADAYIKKAAVTRADVALRIVESQLLFAATTYAEREAIKASLARKFATKTTATTALNAVVSDLTGLLSSTPVTFPDTIVPASGGERSSMGKNVDERVRLFLVSQESAYNQLFSGSNSDLFKTTTELVKPSIYVQEIPLAMKDFLMEAVTALTAETPGTPGFSTVHDKYALGWNQLLTEIAASVDNPAISPTTKTRVLVDRRVDSSTFTSIFPVTTVAELKTKTANLLNPRGGYLLSINKDGNGELKATIVDVVDTLSKGLALKTPSYSSNAATTAKNTKPLASAPTVTIDSTSTLTTALADGTEMVVTGDGDVAARLRDPVFQSAVTNKLDANLKIFLNKSARVGLGTANISSSPGQTPNVLGGASETSTKSVQIIPDGNCFIDVNSDLLIGGSKPIIPTLNFGKGATHQITFYSEVPRTITIAANTTLDLSDFGNNEDAYADNSKQIVFAGKVKLVLESGAKIRFPHLAAGKEAKGPVLYFNDDSQLVFQGDATLVGKPWSGSLLTGADCKRNKLIGSGQIWLNKGALMYINKPALVSVEADFLTPKTNITISLQRNAKLLIGTENLSGGALQIGNIFDGGSKIKPHATEPDTNFPNTKNNPNYPGSFTPRTTSIDFTLTINGPQASVQVGRSGFLGFAAGAVNKDGALEVLGAGPNGITGVAGSAWQLQRLYNVSNITLDVTQGSFVHNVGVDGTNKDCSLFAVGQLTNNYPASKYVLKLGQPSTATIFGGGNLYYVDKTASMVINTDGTLSAAPHTVNVDATASNLSFVVSNTGKHTVLAPDTTMRSRKFAIKGITDYAFYGRGLVATTNSAITFAGPLQEWYYYVKMNSYADSLEKPVTLNKVGTSSLVTFIDSETIVRQSVIDADIIRGGTVNQALAYGYLLGTQEADGGLPTKFTVPKA